MTNDQAVVWMAERGITCYQFQIAECEEAIEGFKADAGRYWNECEQTLRWISLAQFEIQDIKQAAYDRYQDKAED